ncbi:MAG: HEAT repeat domain-containing protein [Armatimonadetes bacterium]|nr:HEAT repeat domain-containing protein [Armatimonadota bacterium]
MKQVIDVERTVRQLDGMYLLPQPDRDRRIAAAAALGVPAVAALERLCRSRTERTRNAAFKALELIGDPATSALVRLLRSRRSDVRSGALHAILQIRTPTSLDALRDVVMGWLRASRTMRRARAAVFLFALAVVGLLLALDGLGWLGFPKVLEGRLSYLNPVIQMVSLVLTDRELLGPAACASA